MTIHSCNFTTIKEKLKKWLLDTGREILKEVELDDRWGFVVKHGNFVIQLVHPKHLRFMLVGFIVQFPPEVIAEIEEFCKDGKKKIELEFGLKSAISSPLTAYRILYNEKRIIVGFEISKKIFPFHEGFSIKDLDEAIQAVVSVGVLGLSYLEVVFGAKKIEQEISESIVKPPPDSMYI